MSEEIDFSQPLACDVAIAGAGLAGLVTAAILAKHGRHVVVVDRTARVGGRTGGTPYRGYWLDGGQRDGTDIGDLQVGWRYGRLAAQEADVDVPLEIVEPTIRVHHLPEGGGPAAVHEGSWGARGFTALARDCFGCPEASIPDFVKVLALLGGAAREEREAAITKLLPDWLAEHAVDPDCRRAVLQMVATIFCEYPERASAGRLMAFFGRRDDLPDTQPAFPNHPEVGGIQGLVEPFAQATRARGGRILLGLAPTETTFDGDGRATGFVALSEGHLALEVRAAHTVLASPLWQALSLLPADRVDPELLAMASALEDEQADAICWQAGLTRLPRVRATGAVESHVGWNRILVGAERRYRGGFHIPSLSSQCSAPPGRHLLHAFVGRWLRKREQVDWATSRHTIDRVIDHLRDFYLDLDECIEWSAYQLIERPACLAWYWAPIRRHGVDVPGCPNLYLASTTFESDAGPIDIAAHAGMEAAHAILDAEPGRRASS